MGSTSQAAVCLDATVFHPSSSVQWLGYWFTPPMESSVHFHKCLALVQGAFSIIKQLSHPGMGLASYMNRRLALALILPILTYGPDLLVPNSAILSKMTVLWNRVLRWVTNCFLSTPVSVLPCKACLPPLDLLLPHKRKMGAFRKAYSSCLINLVAARLPPTFTSHFDTTARDSLRHLLRGLRQNYIPLPWDQHRPVPAVRSQPFAIHSDRW